MTFGLGPRSVTQTWTNRQDGWSCGGPRRGEFRRAEESGNRFWQIGIGGSIARNKPANPRQDFGKIPAIETAQQAVGRLGKFQDGDGAAGLEHALNLPQAGFVVGKIAKAEGA